ncbi:hypothetical protein Tco_1426801, partial [Tanacetum coccineum]
KADAEKAKTDKDEEEKHGEEQNANNQEGIDQPEKVQAEVSVPESQVEKPDEKLHSSIQTLSSAEYVNTEVLENKFIRLEKKEVEAMSRFNIPKAIDKTVRAHLMNNVLPKGAPDFDSQKEKKKRKQKDSEALKKDKDQAGSSKKVKSPSKSSKIDKSVHAEETVHYVKMEAGEFVKEDVVDAKDPS